MPDMILEGTVNKPQAYRLLQNLKKHFSVPPPHPNYNSSHIEAERCYTREQLVNEKLA